MGVGVVVAALGVGGVLSLDDGVSAADLCVGTVRAMPIPLCLAVLPRDLSRSRS